MTDDLPTTPRRLRRLAFRVVAFASVFVPAWRRAEWRREWEAEIWYERQQVVRRSTGAIPHALWLLQHHWSLDMLMQDIRYGARMLRRGPLFTFVASLTLALGIGANAAIFSIVNTVLWRSLPFPDSGQLVQLWETNPDRGWTEAECAPANYADWRRLNHSFSGMAAYYGGGRDAWVSKVALTGSGEPERLNAINVTANFFDVLGVTPALGRTFVAEEEMRGRSDVALLTDGFWRRRFGGDPTIVGRSAVLDGRPTAIIGVLPPSFRMGANVDVVMPVGWAPARAAARVPHLLRVVGRLKPGMTIAQARADLAAIATDLEREYPASNTHMGVGVGSLQDWLVGPSRPALLVFFAAVGFVLLVACANVANLMLARGTAREREVAIRTALGASRMRVVRQMLTESLLLAAIGGVLGVGVASAAVRLVVLYGPASLPRLHEITIDTPALLFTFALTTLTGIVFGVVPARQVAGRGSAAALRAGAHQANSGRSAARNALVVAELACSMVLLVGAMLLVRSFIKLNQVDLGFDPRNASTFEVSLPRTVYATPARQQAFVDRLLEKVRAVPGVTGAGASQRGLLNGMLWSSDFTIEHRAPTDFGIEVRHDEVSSGYFAAIGAPIVRGRDFSAADGPDAPLVVVVNEAFVRRNFRGEDPIGQRLNFDRPGGTSPWRTIVGVVRDFREEVVEREARPTIYESLSQNTDTTVNVVLRSALPPAALAPAVRATLRQIDPNVPSTAVLALQDRVDATLASQRFTATLMAVFAFIGIVLASVGLYGVLAYLAERRTHEIGVRIALGATRADVVRLVGRDGLGVVASGIGLGVALALASGRLMTGLLFGVTPTDPITYAFVVLLLVAVTFAAIAMPVRRAMRVSPLVALRAE